MISKHSYWWRFLFPVLLMLAGPVFGSTSGIFGGGPFYSGGTTVMNDLRASGFTTVILWTIHVDKTSGDLILNDQKVVSNGSYVGNSAWPGQLATLKQAPTTVRRIEVGIASWGVDDFGAIKSLMATYGTNTTSILYRNFKALKMATGADALNLDDETLYDVATTVKFSLMCASMGYKISLCPYAVPNFWSSCMSQINSQAPGTVDSVFLQCYAGGAGNDPAYWNSVFGGFKVLPGLWCRNGNNCADGDSAATVASKIAAWKSLAGINGGFMWLYDDMRSCTSGGATVDYARAINSAFMLPAPGGVVATAGGGSVLLTWSAVSGATNYTVKRSASATGVYVTIATNVSTYYQDTKLSAGTRYYYELCGVDGNGEGMPSAPVSAVPCSGALPSGWTDQDIGQVGVAGSAEYCGGTFTIHAGGADIGGRGDICNLASVVATGDSAMIGRVGFISGTEAAAKAGVMFRSDVSSNSACVDLVVTAGQGILFQSRSSGGSVSSTTVAGVAPPVWLQLVRSGNAFTAYYAVDGITWTRAGAMTVAMSGNVMAGLAASAHSSTNSVLAIIDNVSQGAPVIVQQPTSVTRYPGANCTFAAGVSAAQPVVYWWMQDGTNLPAANRTTLTFTNLSVSNAGNYALVASNVFGCATSSVASLVISVVKNSLFPATVASNRPVGYWRLNESMAKTAYDYFGGNHGSYSNVVCGQAGYTSYDRSARFGSTAVVNSYVSVPGVDFANPTNTALSVEAWVNGAAQTNDSGIITKGTGAGGEQFNLDCGSTGHGFRFFVRDASGTAHLANASVAPNGRWHHLVGVCDEANGKVILYVDGTNAAQGTITAGTGLQGSSSLMTIGSRQSGPGTAYDLQFRGYIADVAVYNVALSAAQVLAHYTVTTNRPPVFVSNLINAPDGTAGQNYAWSIAGMASDVNGGAVRYFKNFGPDWLTISADGVVSGTPLTADAGQNFIEAAAADVTGLVGTATMYLNVASAPPITASIVGGTNVVLSWTGGIGPFTVHCVTNLASSEWQTVGALLNTNSVVVAPTNAALFFRVVGQ